MIRWPHLVKSYSQAEVLEYTGDSYWQTIRIGMKGMPTGMKLDTLDAYRYNRLGFGTIPDDELPRCVEVQTDNYINALKRGGFLNEQLQVVK